MQLPLQTFKGKQAFHNVRSQSGANFTIAIESFPVHSIDENLASIWLNAINEIVPFPNETFNITEYDLSSVPVTIFECGHIRHAFPRIQRNGIFNCLID